MKKLVLLLILMTGAAYAQQCPVNIQRVNPWSYGYKYYDSSMTIDFTNVSPKQIRSLKFGVIFLDATGDPHPESITYQYADKVDAGKKKTGRWGMVHLTDGNRRGGAEAWVTKILFTDGTTWEDDGTHECKAIEHSK